MHIVDFLMLVSHYFPIFYIHFISLLNNLRTIYRSFSKLYLHSLYFNQIALNLYFFPYYLIDYKTKINKYKCFFDCNFKYSI